MFNEATPRGTHSDVCSSVARFASKARPALSAFARSWVATRWGDKYPVELHGAAARIDVLRSGTTSTFSSCLLRHVFQRPTRRPPDTGP